MPTGYTYKLCEGEQEFKDFALECALAFGACIAQRDSNDCQPQLVEANISFYQQSNEKDQQEINRLLDIPLDEAEKLIEEEFEEELHSIYEGIQKTKTIRERLERTLEDVKKYEPPSSEHEQYKQFMIDQLQTTIDQDGNDSYYVSRLRSLTKLSATEYIKQQIAWLQESVIQRMESIDKELERTEERNGWILSLYDSLNIDISNIEKATFSKL